MATRQRVKTRGTRTPKWRRDYNWERAFRTQTARAVRLHRAMEATIRLLTDALAVPRAGAK